MKKASEFKEIDLSTATQFDFKDIYPEFFHLIISYNSITENYTDDDYRILELIIFADNYQISDLSDKL